MDKYIFKKSKSLSGLECDHIISYFSNCRVLGEEKGQKRIEDHLGRTVVSGSLNERYFQKLREVLIFSLRQYTDKHLFLHALDPIVICSWFNIQRSNPGEGYFKEHCEHGKDGVKRERLLAWMIYLNDIKYKGGTHWPQQRYTTRPRKGDLYIWPAAWTHSNYGISAPKEVKYLATGWMSFG